MGAPPSSSNCLYSAHPIEKNRNLMEGQCRHFNMERLTSGCSRYPGDQKELRKAATL